MKNINFLLHTNTDFQQNEWFMINLQSVLIHVHFVFHGENTFTDYSNKL